MRVFVYRNLHKKCWSVRALEGTDRGRVIAHTMEFTLDDATFKVSVVGRARVLRERQKNVHAGIVGTLVALECFDLRVTGAVSTQVTYDPYQYDSFVEKHTGVRVNNSKIVWGCGHDVYAILL